MEKLQNENRVLKDRFDKLEARVNDCCYFCSAFYKNNFKNISGCSAFLCVLPFLFLLIQWTLHSLSLSLSASFLVSTVDCRWTNLPSQTHWTFRRGKSVLTTKLSNLSNSKREMSRLSHGSNCQDALHTRGKQTSAKRDFSSVCLAQFLRRNYPTLETKTYGTSSFLSLSLCCSD